MARRKRLGGTEWSLYLPEHDREPRYCFSITPGQISLFIPRDEQSIPEGPRWESIATYDTENVTFRDTMSRSGANHPFAKSKVLFSQPTQWLIRHVRTRKACRFFKTQSLNPLQPGSKTGWPLIDAEATPHTRTVWSGRILLQDFRLAAPRRHNMEFLSVPDLPGGMGLAIANNETRLAQFAMLAEKPFHLSHIGVYCRL